MYDVWVRGQKLALQGEKSLHWLNSLVSTNISRNIVYLIHLDGLVFQPNTVTMGPRLLKYSSYKHTLLLSSENKRVHFGPALCYSSPNHL